jgi:hypothetical protein
MAPDGMTLLLARPDGIRQLTTLAGDTRRDVASLGVNDRLVAWSRDSRAIFVQRGLDVPAVVDRVDLDADRRTRVAELSPDGVGAAALIYVVDWLDAGGGYAYNYTMLPSALFVVQGGGEGGRGDARRD